MAIGRQDDSAEAEQSGAAVVVAAPALQGGFPDGA